MDIITEDVAADIFSFLSVRDALRLQTTCQKFAGASLVDQFWKCVIERNHLLTLPAVAGRTAASIPSSSSSAVSSMECSLSSTATSITLCGMSYRKLGNLFYRNAKRLNTDAIEVSLLKASPSDRPEERMENALSVSRCKILMQRANTRGIHAQFQCGCAASRPCYFSSTSNRNPDSDEEVVVVVKRPHCIVGFTVTPYQSFFQPGDPTFAPKGVRLQLIIPSVDGADPVVIHETRFFPVENIYRSQYFQLEAPLLVNAAFWVRIIFVGKQQRQPIEENDGYYCCISTFKLIGFELFSESQAQSESCHTNSSIKIIRDSEVVIQPGLIYSMPTKYFVPVFNHLRTAKESESVFSVLRYPNEIRKVEVETESRDFGLPLARAKALFIRELKR